MVIWKLFGWKCFIPNFNAFDFNKLKLFNELYSTQRLLEEKQWKGTIAIDSLNDDLSISLKFAFIKSDLEAYTNDVTIFS